jgi:hypothetical protein
MQTFHGQFALRENFFTRSGRCLRDRLSLRRKKAAWNRYEALHCKNQQQMIFILTAIAADQISTR